MESQEIIIVSIVFGSIVAVTFLSIVGSIIKAWIKKGSKNNLSENQEFLDALREFKESIERRVANLEAIAADEEPSRSSSKSGEEKKNVQSAIELELDDGESSGKEESSDSSRLRNMLNQ